MSEPTTVTKISDDPKDFLTGASSDTVNPTQGGTTKDGNVAVFAPSRAGGTDSAAKSDDSSTS
jgi:hypothetical protein